MTPLKWIRGDNWHIKSEPSGYTICRAVHHGPEGDYVYLLHRKAAVGVPSATVGPRAFNAEELKQRAEEDRQRWVKK